MTKKNRDLKSLSTAIALAVATSFSAGSATASNIVIKKNVVKWNGKNFFVRNAANVELGTYGIKREPITQANYVETEGVFSDIGSVNKNGPHTVSFGSDFDLSHAGSFAMPLEAVELGIDSDGMVELMRAGKCSFQHRSVYTGQVKDNLNDASLRHTLKMDNAYRMVGETLSVKSCEIDRSTNTGLKLLGNTKFAGGLARLSGDDSISSSKTLNFRYADNTVIGYLLLKLDWDKKKKSKRDQIISVKTDQRGPS